MSWCGYADALDDLNSIPLALHERSDPLFYYVAIYCQTNQRTAGN